MDLERGQCFHHQSEYVAFYFLGIAPYARVLGPDQFTEDEREEISSAYRAALAAIDGPQGLQKLQIHQLEACRKVIGPARRQQTEKILFNALDDASASLAYFAWDPVFTTVATPGEGSCDNLWSVKRASALVSSANAVKQEGRAHCSKLRATRLAVLKAARLPRGREGSDEKAK